MEKDKYKDKNKYRDKDKNQDKNQDKDGGKDKDKANQILGTYMKQIRENGEISMQMICRGLCSRQELVSMENGEWEPGYFLLEAILARLGMEAETYEYFLNYEEWAHLEKRMEIMESILWNRLDQAEELLEDYRIVYVGGHGGLEGHQVDCNNMREWGLEGRRVDCDNMGEWELAARSMSAGEKFAMQFYLAMLGQVRRSKAFREELYDIYDHALRLTVPDAWEKPLEELVLSVNELNLMLEAEWNREGGPRPEYFLRTIEYIEKRLIDGRGRVKVYPKAVYFYLHCQEEIKIADESFSIKQSRQSEKCEEVFWDYCEKGLEMLRDNGRMYYLWEILNIRERLLERRLERFVRQKSWKVADTEAALEENRGWREALEQVYDTWNVSRETSDSCYIYMPKTVSCINDVIRIRREMLGLSPKELCQGICSEDTLRRLEKRKSRGQRPILRELFQRLGLSGQFVQSELVTGDMRAQELLEELRNWAYKCCWDEAEETLERIKGLDNMKLPCNRQMIANTKGVIKWKKNEIGNEEYCCLQRKALEITMPLKAFINTEKKYLTCQEQTCIQNMMLGMDREGDEFMDCIRAFEELYRPRMERGIMWVSDGMYAFIMGTVGSQYGDMGEYDKADMYNEPIIQGHLRFRRLQGLPYALYAHWWNCAERRKKDVKDDRLLNDVDEVTKCLLLCGLAKERKNELFCRNKLSHLLEEK